MSKLSLIVEQLKDKLIYKTDLSSANDNVENMEFLEVQSELFCSRIYVATPEEARKIIPNIQSIEKKTVLVTGGDADAAVFEDLKEICSKREVALICTGLSVYSVGNIINGILFQYQKQAQKFFEASVRRYDSQQLISIASELTGCPVFILSTSCHVIKCAGDCGKWSEGLFKGEIRDSIKSLSANGGNYHCFKDDSGTSFHFHSIIYDGNFLYYLLIIDDTGRAQDFENILKQTAEGIIFWISENKQSDMSQTSEFALFMHDLVEQKIMTAPEIQERLEALPYPPRQRRRMAVIMFDDTNKIVPYDFVLAQLRDLFPDYNMSFFRGEIVVLICEDERIFNIDIDEKRINEILAPYNGCMCVGHATSDLTKCRTQYLLTRHALIVARKLRRKTDGNTRVFRFQQYATYVLIDMFAHRFQEIQGNNDILYLGHPAVVKITRYDRQHNNNLRDVLYAYLMNGRNLVKTAEVMHMHRNTVFYKINQIKELIGMDLEDGRLQQDFLLSCQIISYYEDYMGETLRPEQL